MDEHLLLGMMWRSRKALDLLRDDRVAVHSTVSDRDGTEGDFKIYGMAEEVVDRALREAYADAIEARIDWRPADPYHLFAVDIRSSGFVVFGEERYALAWNPEQGLRRRSMPED